MGRILTTILCIILIVCLIQTPIHGDEINVNSDMTTTIDMVYFYVNICESCTEAKEQINLFIHEIKDADLNMGTRFIAYNLSYYKGHEYETYQTYLDHYNLPLVSTNTPILFVGDTYLEGESAIIEGLPILLEDIQKGYLPQTPILDTRKSPSNHLEDTFEGFNLVKMFGIGLINGLNPCSFSMLLLLISIIMMKDVPVIRLGFTFLLGKFIAFILLGTVLYQTLGLLNDTGYLFYTKVVVGLFVIILAFLNLYDFTMSRQEAYGKIKNQLPGKVRQFNHKLIQHLTASGQRHWLFLSMFLLGIFLAASEFLCTGQVYMITINYMIQTSSALTLTAITYLVIYSFGFILPPGVVLIIIAKTDELFSVSEFIREKMPLIKLMTAITLLILGLLTILL